jgi:energy-coupling factor transport system permease protein
LLCAALLVVCISYISHLPAFVLCLVVFTVLQLVSRISLRYVLRSLRPFAIFLLFAFVIEVVFYVPASSVKPLWHWWILSVSWEGIFVSALTMVRVVLLYYLVVMFTFTTSLVDLTDGLEVLLAPLQKIGLPVNAFVMILVIAFKFVPIFVAELERLIKAQAARGMNVFEGNLVRRVTKLTSLLVPLFVSALQRVKALSVAMEARCFGGRPGWQRSKRRELIFTRADRWTLAFVIGFCIAMVGVNILSPL